MPRWQTQPWVSLQAKPDWHPVQCPWCQVRPVHQTQHVLPPGTIHGMCCPQASYQYCRQQRQLIQGIACSPCPGPPACAVCSAGSIPCTMGHMYLVSALGAVSSESQGQNMLHHMQLIPQACCTSCSTRSIPHAEQWMGDDAGISQVTNGLYGSMGWIQPVDHVFGPLL